MEDSKDSSVRWRKQVDEKLKRLHSLQFGVDLALERCDFSTAYVLGLLLNGFLDSQSLTDLDEALVRPIRREAVSKLDKARQSLVPESDRASGHVFSNKGEIDIEKIKNSKCFRALVQKYDMKTSNGLGNELIEKDLRTKPSKIQ